MKSRLMKFVVPLLALLMLIGVSVGVVNKLSAAHAASVPPSGCGWQLVQDAWVAPGLGSHLAESQMYHSTCSGAVYCRVIDHSTTVWLSGSVEANGSTGSSFDALNIPPRGYENGVQLNGSPWYDCSGDLSRSDSPRAVYSYTTARVSV